MKDFGKRTCPSRRHHSANRRTHGRRSLHASIRGHTRGAGEQGPNSQRIAISKNFPFTAQFKTYTRESDATVTALGCSSGLLEVLVDELSTRRLYDAPPVRGGVVGITLADCNALGHFGGYEKK